MDKPSAYRRLDVKKLSLIKVLYGGFFCLVLPMFLILFSILVEVPLRPIHMPVAGAVLFLFGIVVLGLGIATLWVKTGTPPMNAYPSKRLVKDGIYRIFPHPIYLGFTILCLGASIGFGSATGLFLTTPIVGIACIAIVFGYERPYLKREFGELPNPILGLSFILRPMVRFLFLDKLWKTILRATEKISNSWREVRIGPLRIINHGIFGGLAGGVGAFMVVLLCGGTNVFWVVLILGSMIVGAGLWAQLLEGSSMLLRPFGYYGGFFGAVVGGMAIIPFEGDHLLILASFACAGPFIQAIGRVRCLIQGCCHGRTCSDEAGIRVYNEHSRVCVIDGLKSAPIYPTQLYSLLGNSAVGGILLVLWLLQAPLAIIGGLFLVLTNAVRFIEEGYRGETQTKRYLDVPIYQWIAVALFFVGMAFMLLPAPDAPAVDTSSIVPGAIVAVAFFFVCWFATGIDFPKSKARFSRLSG